MESGSGAPPGAVARCRSNRGHALTIDSGWREVADKAMAFVKRFV
jgi:hypothetical protein